jgi:putative membrane protein
MASSEASPLPGTTAQLARDGFWLRIIFVVSAVLAGAVAFLILGPRPAGMEGLLDVSGLPIVNATFNAITAVLLVVGVALARQRKLVAHKRVMLSAFGTSAAFLVSYVLYHWFKAGPKAYTGDLRGLYLTILLSHVVLAVVILPMALITLYRGWQDQRARHRRLARITFPLWLYVSVTGVVIYGMLYL